LPSPATRGDGIKYVLVDLMELREWFRVRVSDLGIHLDVSPPNRAAWQANIAWSEIVRVCYKAEDGLISDGWYFFTKHRPESYVVPVEADGGQAVLDELLKRKLFDAELATRAACAVNESFCWPPVQ
jgi:hypothetical protein